MRTALVLGAAALALRLPRGHARDDQLRPIASRSLAARVCAELCAAGMGGQPCGAGCADLAPTALPVQSASAGAGGAGGRNATRAPAAATAAPRADACDVLCDNGLGYPLCGCRYAVGKTYVADFVEVCSHFCVKFDYQIFGCQNCSLYRASADQWPNGLRTLSSDTREANTKVNWDLWCDQMCSQGDGGAACNCDLLPMAIMVPGK